jgi:hypothetical protein
MASNPWWNRETARSTLIPIQRSKVDAVVRGDTDDNREAAIEADEDRGGDPPDARSSSTLRSSPSLGPMSFRVKAWSVLTIPVLLMSRIAVRAKPRFIQDDSGSFHVRRGSERSRDRWSRMYILTRQQSQQGRRRGQVAFGFTPDCCTFRLRTEDRELFQHSRTYVRLCYWFSDGARWVKETRGHQLGHTY